MKAVLVLVHHLALINRKKRKKNHKLSRMSFQRMIRKKMMTFYPKNSQMIWYKCKGTKGELKLCLFQKTKVN